MMLDELTAEQLLVSIWTVLCRVETNLALPPAPLELPPPIVQVAAPDLTDIVTAVTGLRAQATADEIARALAQVLAPQADTSAGDALAAVADGLKMLDHRLQGFGKQAYGGGAVTLASGASVTVTGTVATTSPAPTTPRSGQKLVAVTNTAVALSASVSVFGVIVSALAGNNGNVYVGPSGVTTATGFELQPGQATSIAIDDAAKMFINGTAGDGVCWLGS